MARNPIRHSPQRQRRARQIRTATARSPADCRTPDDRQPGDAAALPDRSPARRRRIRSGLSGHARRPIGDRASNGVHQGERRIDGWLREAYFGQLLDGHPRAIRVFDTFPLVAPTGACCTASRWIRAVRRSEPFLPRRAARAGPRQRSRREIAGILEVLGKLHRGQLLHRDLTPMNVFVCDEHRLKLGDFGIVASTERSARDHRPHDERADRAERDPRGRRAEMAGARRRLSGRAAAGDAGQGRHRRQAARA